ncbi:MAG TPA: glycosyltransferase family 4 protein [Flavobacteriales bacterium]|nr:glycosyltransferase family 4 protein [Flavobacteriales bacterium]HNU57793.1 glycosyltransferase family 4 protein [Flavobacteriales bacterium]
MSSPKDPKKHLLYLYPRRFHFVAKDIEALQRHRSITEHQFNTGPKWLLPLDYLRQFLFLTIHLLKGHRNVIAHFAGHHTVLPTALGFKVRIIIAGSDACSFPGIHYGSFRKPLMRLAIAFSMRRAAQLLPVHRSLVRFENGFSDFGPREQGYARFITDLRTPSMEVPYGFDVEAWPLPAEERDPRTVLCVATGVEPGNAVHFRKGVDLIIASARSLPEHRFTVVGAARADAYHELPPNMRILGGCSPAELRELYADHGIYVQPSVMEGFPNALCEAMLMGCIPIASGVTSMPEIIGDSGAIIEERQCEMLVNAIRKLSAIPADQVMRRRRAVHDRIIPFTMDRRVKTLLSCVDEIK